MSKHFKALGIDRLAIQEQIALAIAILDNLAEQHPPADAEPAQAAAHPEPSPEDLMLWEEIKAKAAAQLGR